MDSILSPDSKFMQMLGTLADMMFLNMFYLVCCIPVFTIPAAQAGLYEAMGHVKDPERDGTCWQAYFKGFKTGFGKVTLAWLPFGVGMGLMLYLLMPLVVLQDAGLTGAPVWAVLAGIGMCQVVSSVLTLFHSRFSCTAGQLILNSFLVTFRYPLRSILVGITTWAPILVLFFLPINIFLQLSVPMALIYYSMSFILNLVVFKEPFAALENNFRASEANSANDGQ